MKRRNQGGLSLVELLVTVLIAGLLLVVGIPGFSGIMEKNRLRSAIEAVSTDLNYARTESILRGVGSSISVSFTTDTGTNWCYGLSTAAGCDCTIADVTDVSACVVPVAGTNVLKVVDSADFDSEVSMTAVTFAGNTTTFSSLRDLAGAGQVSLAADGRAVNIQMTALGRVRVCSSSDLGYGTC